MTGPGVPAGDAGVGAPDASGWDDRAQAGPHGEDAPGESTLSQEFESWLNDRRYWDEQEAADDAAVGAEREQVTEGRRLVEPSLAAWMPLDELSRDDVLEAYERWESQQRGQPGIPSDDGRQFAISPSRFDDSGDAPAPSSANRAAQPVRPVARGQEFLARDLWKGMANRHVTRAHVDDFVDWWINLSRVELRRDNAERMIEDYRAYRLDRNPQESNEVTNRTMYAAREVVGFMTGIPLDRRQIRSTLNVDQAAILEEYMSHPINANPRFLAASKDLIKSGAAQFLSWWWQQPSLGPLTEETTQATIAGYLRFRQSERHESPFTNARARAHAGKFCQWVLGLGRFHGQPHPHADPSLRAHRQSTPETGIPTLPPVQVPVAPPTQFVWHTEPSPPRPESLSQRLSSLADSQDHPPRKRRKHGPSPTSSDQVRNVTDQRLSP